MEQQSGEWLKWRLMGLGGSDIATILNISPWGKTRYQLWEEKRGKKIEKKTNFAMERGIKGEPRARAHLELITGLEWPADLVEHPEKPHWRVSLDGRNGKKITEIKCIKFVDTIPPYYLCQVQYQLMVCGAEECIFLMFNPSTDQVKTISVLPDLEMQATIAKEVDAFWDLVVSGVQPELTEDDAVILDDDKEFMNLADLYKEADMIIKENEKIKESLREKILEFAKIHPYIKSSIISVCGYYKKGTVDYSKVIELIGVDLEKYRKKGGFQYTVNLTKKTV